MGFDRRPHNPGSFSALLGGDDWSMALSKYEYDDFVKVRCPYPCIIKHVQKCTRYHGCSSLLARAGHATASGSLLKLLLGDLPTAVDPL